MNKLVAIAIFALIGVTYAGHGHSVVDGDILNRVADVLSHGYGGKVILGYPRKAYLVDHSYSVAPGYGGYGGYGGHGGHGIGYARPAPIVHIASYASGGHYGGNHGGFGGGFGGGYGGGYGGHGYH